MTDVYGSLQRIIRELGVIYPDPLCLLAVEPVRGILGGLPRFFPIAAILLFPSFCTGTLLPPIRDDASAFSGIAAAPALSPGTGNG